MRDFESLTWAAILVLQLSLMAKGGGRGEGGGERGEGGGGKARFHSLFFVRGN